MSNENKPSFILPDADERLKEYCYAGMKKLFGDKPPKAVKNRLIHELKVVAKNMHSSYYLLAILLAQEAERLHHSIFFRGIITSSLIAYTGGFSNVNPMEQDYGGVNIPFEITREEYEVHEPCLDIDCGVAFVFYAQSFLNRLLPEYRYLSLPLNGAPSLRTVRLYFVREEDLPTEEVLDTKEIDPTEYPDFLYFDKYFHITLIGYNQMELVRYNTYYKGDDIRFEFNEFIDGFLIPDLWKYVKKHDESLTGFKRLKVQTYEELVTVLGMAHSTGVWTGLAKKMVLDGRLPLSEMIGTRDDVFLYLLKLGMKKDEAYWIMEHVRKGKHLTDEEIVKLRGLGADEWFLDLCMHVKYLFPKAHIAQGIRRDAFCLYEPEEFTISEHCVMRNSFLG